MPNTICTILHKCNFQRFNRACEMQGWWRKGCMWYVCGVSGDSPASKCTHYWLANWDSNPSPVSVCAPIYSNSKYNLAIGDAFLCFGYIPFHFGHCLLFFLIFIFSILYLYIFYFLLILCFDRTSFFVSVIALLHIVSNRCPLSTGMLSVELRDASFKRSMKLVVYYSSTLFK